MAIGLDGTVHAEAEDVFHRWRAKYTKALRDAGAENSSVGACQVNTSLGLAFVRRCTRAVRAWNERLEAELVRGRPPKTGRERGVIGGKGGQNSEVRAVKRARPAPIVVARSAVPEAVRRASERLETRWDLSNVPIDGGDAMAGSAADACQLVCPLGPNLRAGDAAVGGSVPLVSQQKQLGTHDRQ
jgi:hypothetical protein